MHYPLHELHALHGKIWVFAEESSLEFEKARVKDIGLLIHQALRRLSLRCEFSRTLNLRLFERLRKPCS